MQTERTASLLAAAGVCQLAARALLAFPTDRAVQKAALRAVVSLAHQCPANAALLRSSTVLIAVAAALAAFSRDHSLAEMGCWSFAALLAAPTSTIDSSSSNSSSNNIADVQQQQQQQEEQELLRQVCAAAVQAFTAHSSVVKVQHRACAALLSAVHAGGAAAVAACGKAKNPT
eukprot:1788-Heterococcus_DN1.PRE.1